MALVNERVRILKNECVGPNLYLMTLSSPAIASAIEPGQFVHMKIPGMEGHVLRRPFSIYAADAQAGTLDVLYQTVGFGTKHLAALEAGVQGAELIGPVGRRWNAPDGCKRALLVAGGVGAAPLFMLCQELVGAGVHVDVVLGAQTAGALVCLKRYQQVASGEVRVATDDGSLGRSGFCTSLSQEALEAGVDGQPYHYVACCGPEPLMKIVAGQAATAQVPCQISLEKRMACGMGACLSCVVDTVDGKKRSCVDGPVFDAAKVVW